jgi:hypothetical protein
MLKHAVVSFFKKKEQKQKTYVIYRKQNANEANKKALQMNFFYMGYRFSMLLLLLQQEQTFFTLQTVSLMVIHICHVEKGRRCLRFL